MGLEQAGQLGTVEQVYGYIEMFGVIMQSLLPVIGGIFAVGFVIKLNQSIKKRKALKQQQKQQQIAMKQQQKVDLTRKQQQTTLNQKPTNIYVDKKTFEKQMNRRN